MRRVRGLDAKISKDSTGGFISVDWHCPYLVVTMLDFITRQMLKRWVAASK